MALTLKKLPLFEKRKDYELEEIASVLEYKRCEELHKVVEYGKEGDKFFIVLEGFADVVKPYTQLGFPA